MNNSLKALEMMMTAAAVTMVGAILVPPLLAIDMNNEHTDRRTVDFGRILDRSDTFLAHTMTYIGASKVQHR